MASTRRTVPATRWRAGVPEGPIAYRLRLRRRGPAMGVLPAAVLALTGQALLTGSPGLWRSLAGLACTVLAAPFVLVLGAPFSSGPAIVAAAVALSVLLWLAVGSAAAVRATRRPAVAWREYWVEYAWAAAAVWTGIVLAVLVVDVAVGRPLS